MAVKGSASPFSCIATSLSSPFQSTGISQMSLSRGLYDNQKFNLQQLVYAKVKSCQFSHGTLKLNGKLARRKYILFSSSEDLSTSTGAKIDASEEQDGDPSGKDMSTVSTSSSHYEGTSGKPGLISFYNRPYKREDDIFLSVAKRNQNNLLWFIGPAILVASFIFPSLYLRKILSTVFEDSLLTDFLILFFTEALFYSGVAVFLLLIDHLWRPIESISVASSNRPLAPQLGDRISSVTVLALSLIIPLVTMGLVWPWTGPAASATLAPYLVGIIVQFAFEQYARYLKSPSGPAIPIIFQIYRLHQLNRAAQLVTALSFTVRGAEMTSHNLAIHSSLGMLLNVLQFLGVICIWSLSSFIMRFFPSSAMIEK